MYILIHNFKLNIFSLYLSSFKYGFLWSEIYEYLFWLSTILTSGQYSLFVLMCRKTHITHSLTHYHFDLQSSAEMMLEITFHSLPCRTGSSCSLFRDWKKLAFWYHINWNDTLSGRVSVLLVELVSGTHKADLGTRIEVAGA